MSLKSWVLHRVHETRGLTGRPDLAPREPDFQPTRPAPESASPARHEPGLRGPAADPLADIEQRGA